MANKLIKIKDFTGSIIVLRNFLTRSNINRKTVGEHSDLFRDHNTTITRSQPRRKFSSKTVTRTTGGGSRSVPNSGDQKFKKASDQTQDELEEGCYGTVPEKSFHLVLHSTRLKESEWSKSLIGSSRVLDKFQRFLNNREKFEDDEEDYRVLKDQLMISLSESEEFETDEGSSSLRDEKEYLINGAMLHSIDRTVRFRTELFPTEVEIERGEEGEQKFKDLVRLINRIVLSSSRDFSGAGRLLDERIGILENNHLVAVEPKDTYHVYVCTHFERDCRCGIRGRPLLNQLRNLNDDQKTSGTRSRKEDDDGASDEGGGRKRVLRFHPISHIGGHRYAGNVLIYPIGDWYGMIDPDSSSTSIITTNPSKSSSSSSSSNLTQPSTKIVKESERLFRTFMKYSDVPRTEENIVNDKGFSHPKENKNGSIKIGDVSVDRLHGMIRDRFENVWWEKWRGRIGISKELQKEIYRRMKDQQ